MRPLLTSIPDSLKVGWPLSSAMLSYAAQLLFFICSFCWSSDFILWLVIQLWHGRDYFVYFDSFLVFFFTSLFYRFSLFSSLFVLFLHSICIFAHATTNTLIHSMLLQYCTRMYTCYIEKAYIKWSWIKKQKTNHFWATDETLLIFTNIQPRVTASRASSRPEC